MVDLAEFQKRLKHYCRTIEYNQHQLARDIGLSPTAFSNKINGTRGAPFSRLEIKNIITKLVLTQAITTRREVAELLSLMDLKEVIFSPAEWQSPPFVQLETSESAARLQNGAKPPLAKTPFSLNNGLTGTNGKNEQKQLLTFLFTNFGDSTRLWQFYPGLMPGILLKHNRIVQESIESESGKVFKNTAKEFFTSFTDPCQAVLAAANLQRRLQAEEWPSETGPVKVSVALHTGMPEMEHGGAFFGQPINRTAELLAVGQPGQILLTSVTAGLLLEQLPADLNLRDLGSHHLKDLDRLENIYQLEGKDLPDSFAPLTTPENYPGNLPFQLTSFVGRENEQKEIKQLLKTRRLIMLTGMGGVGKTRLALEIASQIRDKFKDGVWLVGLASISDPAFIVPALARIFGLKEELYTPLIETLLRFLKKKQLLLLLDNCEHVIQECASLAELLLRNCPGLVILATSRTALEITGETVRQIQSLAVPSAPQTLEQLAGYASVKLFTERAEAVNTGFQLTDATALLVSDICVHLDGIPLALELAAARLHTVSLGEIASSLNRRFQTLGMGNRASQPRHQTLKSLVDWSYNALSAQEQTLLRRVSVFPGSWRFAAMAEVCLLENTPKEALRDLLLQLVSKSLVVAETGGEESSYRLLETIRLYGQEKLVEAGEAVNSTALFRCFYLRLAEDCEAGLHGPQTNHWLAILEREQANFRSLFGQALPAVETETTWQFTSELDKDTWQLLLRMGGALGTFWIKQGYWSEGRRWLETLLDFTTRNHFDIDPLIEAKARLMAGNLAWTQGDYPQSTPLLKKSLELYQEQGDNPGISEASLALGKLASKQGYFEEASRLFTESLRQKQGMGDVKGMAEVLNQKGQMAHNQFDYDTAKTCYRESLNYYRQTGQKEGEASILNNLAAVASRLKDYTSGEVLARESLQIYRHLGNRPGIIAALNSLGIMAYRQNRIVEAVRIHNECLEMRQEMGDKPGMAASYQNLGNIAYTERKYKEARQQFGVALAIYREIGERNYLPRVINNLANIDLLEKNYAQAQASYEECLAIYMEIEDTGNAAKTLSNLGLLAYLSGDYLKAQRDYSATLSMSLKINSDSFTANILTGLAGVYYRLAQPLEFTTMPLDIAKYYAYLDQMGRLIGVIRTFLTKISLELGHTEFEIYNEVVEWVQARLSEKVFNDLVEEGQTHNAEIIGQLKMVNHV